MIKMKLTGTHYDMGYVCGKQFLQAGIQLKKLPAMHNAKERIGYAMDCIEIYKQYYPEILEELQGLADAQGLSFEEVAAFILGMYAYTADVHCTCFALKQENTVLLGRNSDFLVAVKDMCLHVEYEPENGYACNANSTAFIQIEDGINEAGLAMGITFIYPVIKRSGFNTGILVRYLLETCNSVKEAIHTLQSLPIGSAQTITMIDATGDMAVVECNCMEIEVFYPKEKENYVVATNQFRSERMRKYQCTFLEDDLFSEKRYRCASHALRSTASYDVSFAKDLLAGKYGFMCQYDPSLGVDTVWSSIYDITNHQIYLCTGNPSRMPFEKQENGDTRYS